MLNLDEKQNINFSEFYDLINLHKIPENEITFAVMYLYHISSIFSTGKQAQNSRRTLKKIFFNLMFPLSQPHVSSEILAENYIGMTKMDQILYIDF